MADLETAATEALEKVKSLEAEIEEAEQRLGDLKEELEESEEQLQDAWQELTEGVESVLEKLNEQTSSLSDGVQEAGEALAELGRTVRQQAGEADEALGSGRDDVTAYGQTIDQTVPRAEHIQEGLQETFQALSERAAAAESRLDELVTSVRELLAEDVVEDLDSLQERLQKESQEVVARVQDGVEEIDENFNIWADHLEQMKSRIAAAFDQAGPYLEESVQETLERLDTEQAGALEQLSSDVEDLESALKALAEVVADCEADLSKRLTAVDEGSDETAGDLEAARKALAKVTEVLASYTFVSG